MQGPELARYMRRKLNYNPDTGEFTWRTGFKQIKRGSVAGSKTKDGYWAIRLRGKLYFAHRLAWLWSNGYDSENYIDHKNGDRLDNRISNLREVSPRCNTQNTAKTYRKTASKYKGVARKGKRWRAYIEIAGKKKHLGTFDTEWEAACARLKAEEEDPNWSCDLQDHNLITALEELL